MGYILVKKGNYMGMLFKEDDAGAAISMARIIEGYAKYFDGKRKEMLVEDGEVTPEGLVWLNKRLTSTQEEL